MTFSKTRPTGYSPGTRLLSSEVEAIDDNLVLALDTRGGTYVQSTPIVFSGSSWTLPNTTFSGTTGFSGGATFSSTAVFSNTATVTGTLTANGAFVANGNVTLGNASGDVVTVNGTTSVSASAPFTVGSTLTANGALVANGNVTLGNASGDTITVNGTMTVDAAAPVTINGFLTVNGNTTLGNASGDTVTIPGTVTISNGLGVTNGIVVGAGVNGTLEVSGACTFESTLAVTGGIESDTGCALPDRLYQMPDSNSSASWPTYTAVFVAATTSPRTLSLGTAGVPTGAVYEVFVRRGVVTTHAVSITHNDGVVSMKNASGSFNYAKFMVIGGALYLMGGELVP